MRPAGACRCFDDEVEHCARLLIDRTREMMQRSISPRSHYFCTHLCKQAWYQEEGESGKGDQGDISLCWPATWFW
jgi:hypothetical protein